MSKLNYKISELTNSNVLNRSDLLMVSRQTSTTIYSSYKLTASILLTAYKTKFEKITSKTIKTNWYVQTGGIFVTDKNIEHPNSVINMKEAYYRYIDKLNALSSEIYDKPHIPSCVGEIIYSTTLNTVDKVRKKYGNNTNWKKIPGRFVLNSNNSLMTLNQEVRLGQSEVQLKLENFPKHQHNMVLDNNEKTIRVNEDVEVPESTVVVPTTKTHGNKGGTPIVLKEEKSVIQVEIKEPVKKATIMATAKIHKNSGGDKSHNNIPPFYTVYMWRRIG